MSEGKCGTQGRCTLWECQGNDNADNQEREMFEAERAREKEIDYTHQDDHFSEYLLHSHILYVFVIITTFVACHIKNNNYTVCYHIQQDDDISR